MSPVMITTHPFFLKNLVWLCLNFAMNATGEAKTVALLAEETETGAKIRFIKLKGLDATPAEKFPGERERALLEALNAVLVIEAGVGEIVISLPKDIRGNPHKGRPFVEMEKSFSKEVEI